MACILYPHNMILLRFLDLLGEIYQLYYLHGPSVKAFVGKYKGAVPILTCEQIRVSNRSNVLLVYVHIVVVNCVISIAKYT